MAAGHSKAWESLLRGRPEEAVANAEAELSEGDGARAAVCLAEALVSLERGEEVDERLDDPMRLELARGQREQSAREYAASEEHFGRALAGYRELGDSSGILVATERLATTLQDSGRRAAAALHHREALELAGALGDTIAVAWTSYGLAYSLLPTGRYAECRDLAERSVELARRLDLPVLVGHAEGFLGGLASIDRDIDEVGRHLDRASEAYASAGDVSREASSRRRRAAAHITKGEYPAALATLRRARDLALGVDDTREASFCLEHLATTHYRLGDLDRAIRQWRTALAEGGDDWPDEWKSGTLQNVGDALRAQGKPEEALAELERSLEIQTAAEGRLGEPDLHVVTAACLHSLGRTSEAIERLDRARGVARELDLPLAEARVLAERARLRRETGDLDGAESDLAVAGRLAANRGSYDLDLSIHAERARAARARGELPRALEELESAIEIGEGVRRRSRESTSVREGAFVRTGALYAEAVGVLHELHDRSPDAGHDARGFDLSQRAKARSLLDLLAETELSLRVRADPRYQEREEGILTRIGELSVGHDPEAAEEIARLEDELTILESELRRADPAYAAVRYPRPGTVAEVQRSLGEDELLVEFLLGEDRSHAWAVTSTSFRLVSLPAAPELERSVRGLLPLLADYNQTGSDPTYFRAVAGSLSRALLDPLLEEVTAAKRILVSPHGALHLLPFEVLLTSGAGATRYSDLPFLVREVEVSYAPAASAATRLRRPGSATWTGGELLLVGDPEFGEGSGVYFSAATGRRIGSLPHARREMEDVGRPFPEAAVRTLSGGTATLGALERQATGRPVRLVHFATHGVFNERRPKLSGLLLTPDPATGDDGFLRLGRIFALDLPCEQIVLSACSSARGERISGEGLVGLTRGFLYAGARSVLAALWPVAGDATSRFMGDFYERLAREGTDGARSLAETKRALISGEIPIGEEVDAAHPFFWAPFVLTGGATPAR